MNHIFTIALNTYKESVRNKVFYIILVFALLLLAFSLVLASLALGEDDRIIKQIGLSAINVFGLLLAAFVGVNLVYEELDKRTIYTIIASGVSRTSFIIGKFLGLFLTVVINVLIMGFLLCLLVGFWPESNITVTLIFAIFLFLFEMMIISALAVLFSSFSTPILSAVLTFMCYVIGHMSEDLIEWSRRLMDDGATGVANLLRVLYFVLPNLEIYNLKNQVIYHEDIGSLGYVTLLYPFAAILYTAILLLIAAISFNRRDFK
ncbi:MAG: ABC transporter permease [Candidatus Omnitrophota bacterium]|jgi:ABC-type transport system involved in multi-copper enzyme maturation permease subunit|nr:MAG: ABC transporter permease [Candidatus Omnitrophota bacterium]